MNWNVVYLILLIIAAVCFLAAAVQRPPTPRVNLVAAGLLFWVLVPLITAARAL